MKKIVLTHDQLVVVDRVVVEPSVHGVGLNDVIFKTYIGGVLCWQYKLWYAMLARCFNEGVKERQPTYKDVTCCEEWLSFGNFLEWVNREVDYNGHKKGFALDKDLIVKGNKVYSPETCSFVPRDVNQLLNGRDALRGEWPVGDTCKGGLITVVFYRILVYTRHQKKRLLCTRLPKKLRLKWLLCDTGM